MVTSQPKKEMQTLASCMNALQESGFTENFAMSDMGLKALTAEKLYQPEEVRIVNFYRFEGESDPADNAILYAIETNDGIKGMLSDAYGPYADSKVTKFIAQVEEIMKKTDPEVKL